MARESDVGVRKKQIDCEGTDAVDSSIVRYPCGLSNADALAGSYEIRLVEFGAVVLWRFQGDVATCRAGCRTAPQNTVNAIVLG
jgi:hypothetical protein